MDGKNNAGYQRPLQEGQCNVSNFYKGLVVSGITTCMEIALWIYPSWDIDVKISGSLRMASDELHSARVY